MDLGSVIVDTFTTFGKKWKEYIFATLLFGVLPYMFMAILVVPTAVWMEADIVALGEEPAVSAVLTVMTPFFVALGIGGAVVSVFSLLLVLTCIHLAHKKKTWKQAFAVARGQFWSAVWLCVLTALLLIPLFMLFIIPGIVFSIYWMLSFVFLAVEGKTGYAALRASKKRIEGHWFRALGYYLVMILLVFSVSIIVQLPSGIMAGILSLFMPIIGGLLGEIVSGVMQSLTAMFLVIFLYVYYRS
ncbi:MAG: hypothetical protein OXR66_05345 [Candidatus Woesearchaeota archaeon]|nr:hypothetical protein [Candidatus Woesearchaeota archaeon]